MSEPLAAKYRPKTFGDVAGQRATSVLLYLICKKGKAPGGKVPGGMLFSGKWGSGKTTLARITAKALNCDAEPGKMAEWPCGLCPSCVAVDNGTSGDVEELDAASNGGVEQMRAVRERAYFGAAPGRHKVIIIDEAHGLSGPAFESSLKVIEEPPPGVTFILVTTQPKAVPWPVRSRCSPFQFDPLPEDVITARLAHVCEAEGLAVEPALLAAITRASNGAMRDAVVRLDQVASAGITTLATWRKITGETDFAPGLLAAAADGDHAALRDATTAALAACGDPNTVVREVTACLSDLMVIASGGAPGQGEALAARRALLAKVGKERASAAMAVLWDLATRVRSEDREGALALALAMVSRRLCPPGQPAPAANGTRPMESV
jgi:DNA polymerase III subunit gamma/tau